MYTTIILITYYVPEMQQLDRLSSVNSDKPHTLSGIIPVKVVVVVGGNVCVMCGV